MNRGTRLVLALAAFSLLGDWTGHAMEAIEIVPDRCRIDALTWSTASALGVGFEPSIEVGPDNTIYVTGAAGAAFVSSEQVSSPLWRSVDDGRSFEVIRRSDEGMPGLEGDIAVDGKGRLYFTDSYLGESYLQRFNGRGSVQEMDRVAIESAGLDDRPWLAAHGDGTVYYMANAVTGPGGRQQVLRSLDGGETFEQPGYYPPEGGMGFLDADPNSDYVYVSTNKNFYPYPESPPTSVDVSISADRGATWKQTTAARYELAMDRTRTEPGFSPIVAVSPKDGSVNVVWTDGAKRVRLARSTDHGDSWNVYDVTPFEGTFGLPWADVAPNGQIGVSFVADAVGEPGASFSVYGMILSPRRLMKPVPDCPSGVISLGAVPGTAAGDGLRQMDFFQLAFAPDNDLHLVFAKGPQDERRVVHHTQASAD